VLESPGWQVYEISEPFETEGITEFTQVGKPHGNESIDSPPYLELQWLSEPPAKRIEALKSAPAQLRKAASKAHVRAARQVVTELASAPVLDARARVFVDRVENEPTFEAFAIWRQRGHTYQAYAAVSDIRSFRSRLAALRRVDYQTWLHALPGQIRKQGQGIAAETTRGGK
jgi:hypothetical protein